VDPFTPSQYRENGLQIWDAAVGIPTSIIRPSKVIKTRMVAAQRNTNTAWKEQIIPALSRVGPLGPDREFLRPSGPFIIDLMYHPMGWRILVGAHALAHRVAEMKKQQWKVNQQHIGPTNYHFRRFVTHLTVCWFYGLPMDVWCLDEGLKGTSDIRQYGIEIKSSSYFRTPILRVPPLSGESPRPDDVIAFLNTSVFLEPHPHGFTTGSNKWFEVNRWSCSPTMIVISGWELIDVVAHQVLCSSDPDNPSETPCYGMNPLDLQSPDTFGAYLAYAVKHRGMPMVDNKRYWLVEDWLTSADFNNAVNEAPPLPCKACLQMNMRADGAPHRPQSRYPDDWDKKKAQHALKKYRYNADELEWVEWETQLDTVGSIIERATIAYETRIYGHTDAIRRRRLQQVNYRKRVIRLKQIQTIAKKINKARRNSQPDTARKLEAEQTALLRAFSGG
jgi:hypothetical protein